MSDHVEALREEARNAPQSGIIEIVDFARSRKDLIPLWVGEGDLPTPAFICEAASRSLAGGETFYTYQSGLPELRQALASYHEEVFGQAFAAERFFVTGSGMQAIQIAIRAVAGFGDEVIVPTPAWPNMAAALGAQGTRPVEVPMDFESNEWWLDLTKIEAAITDKTRAIFINSPSNPTGWTASGDQLKEVLELARRRGLWIISDEVYGRFVYGGAVRAPSFHDVAEAEDRVIYVNTFSKNWAMTGWRVGWIEAHPDLTQVIENLIQYSTSGVAAFMQRAAVAALEDESGFLQEQISRAREGREVVTSALAGVERVRFAAPKGAFYLFFAVDGYNDSRELAMKLVEKTGVGLAPGRAFGRGGDGFVRLCFARNSEQLSEAAKRIIQWLQA